MHEAGPKLLYDPLEVQLGQITGDPGRWRLVDVVGPGRIQCGG
jgi:hypothetical protein